MSRIRQVGHLAVEYLLLILVALVLAGEVVVCIFAIIMSPLLLIGNGVLIALGRRGLFHGGEMSRFEIVIALDGFQKKLVG